MPAPVVVRPAEPRDLPVLGRLGALLVRYHHGLDPRRFIEVSNAEAGYARFLGTQLDNPDAVLLSAELSGGTPGVIGYAWGTLEPRDWSRLLDRHAALHDVIVDPSVRRSGAGAALVLEACRRLHALGAPRVVLDTAIQNEPAQRLFAKLGFRPTMLEMTRELP